MGVTCTIGGVSFLALSSADARYCLFCHAESEGYEIKRFKPFGVAGNYLSRGGFNGTTIRARLRYVGTVSGIQANYLSDKRAWANTAVTIVDEGGASYTRCQLERGGLRIVTPPIATGRTATKAFMDVEGVFLSDAAPA